MSTQQTHVRCHGCDRCSDGVISAGVIPIDITTQNKRIVLCMDFRNEYIDFGGKIEKGESPEQCASRELMEESHGIITITPEDLKLCDSVWIPAGAHLHKVFFVSVTGIDYNKFYHVDIATLPIDMQETYKIMLFDLNKIKLSYTTFGFCILCDQTRTYPLNDRAAKILNMTFKLHKL